MEKADDICKQLSEAAQHFADQINEERGPVRDERPWQEWVFAGDAESGGVSVGLHVNLIGIHVWHAFSISGKDVRRAPWELYPVVEKGVRLIAAELFAKPRGFLDFAVVMKWQEIPKLMREEKWVDAWHLARDCMVGLADMVCMAYDINPDQLTEWEKKELVLVGGIDDQWSQS